MRGDVAGSVLRDMGPADLSAVVAVEEAASILGLSHIFPQDRYPFPRPTIESRWRHEIATPEIDCYAVHDHDVVVGFAAIRQAQLLHFGVAVERWGTGLAALAHDEILDVMRARGVRVAWLRVLTDNARARRFYEKHGWADTGERASSEYAPYAELQTYQRPV